MIPTTKSVITWFNLRVGFVGGSFDVEVKRTKARMTEWKVESKRSNMSRDTMQ